MGQGNKVWGDVNTQHGGYTPTGRGSAAGRLARTAAMGVVLVLAAAPTSAFAAGGALSPADFTGTAQQEYWLTGSFDYSGAWSAATGENVTVAVVGDEQDLGAKDLSNSFKNPTGFGPSVPAVDTVITSPVCYGTEVSSLIAGHGHSAAGGTGTDGTVGVAPHATIMPIVVVPAADGLPTAPDTVQAIGAAVADGAKVIQLDYKTHPDPRITAALNDATARGAVVVAPVGDDGDVQHTFAPADVPGVLAVAGVQQNGRYWPSSVPGGNVSVAAPATNMTVEGPWGNYAVRSGTACAAGLVSGEVADLWSLHPTWTPAEIRKTVIDTASGHGRRIDNKIGYGVANPAAAMRAQNPDHPSPAPGGAAAKGGSSGSLSTVLLIAGGVAGLGVVALLAFLLVRRFRKNRRYALPEPAPLLNYGPSDYPNEYAEYPGEYQYQYSYNPAAGEGAQPDPSQYAYPQYAEPMQPAPVAFDEQGYSVIPQPTAPPPAGEEHEVPPQPQDPAAPQE